ncbi:PP2C family serine/threonine-protein phosphatase [Streptomyces sp. NPDC001835]|uniref:PP2C family serine/threonine-protein phosphatase n=1 Tax=Streptomyces sp. NPDC001835 TaxID=3154528 RepID=UPI0033314461
MNDLRDPGPDRDFLAWLKERLAEWKTSTGDTGAEANEVSARIREFGREAFGRLDAYPAPDDAARLAVAGVRGGEWPQGAEALVRATLHPYSRLSSLGDLATLVRSAVPTTGDRTGPDGCRWTVGRVGLATTTGWNKARGRGHEDNEDRSGFLRLPDGALSAVVLDGVTGPGDGSGGRAAQAALDAVHRIWADGVHHPDEVLTKIRLTAGGTGAAEGAVVGVLCHLAPGTDRPAALAVLGDARAYLLHEPGREPLAVRIGGEGSAASNDFAARVVPDPSEASVVTSFLDTGGVQGQPHVTDPCLRGDAWLVLVSDGACASRGLPTHRETSGRLDGERPAGVHTWVFPDELEDLARRAQTPQHLATLLAMRSEFMGGRDNATALVVELSTTDQTTRPRGWAGWHRSRTEGKGLPHAANAAASRHAPEEQS